MSEQQNIPEEYKKQITSTSFPTEIITLPSGGGDYYTLDNPLRSGKVELRIPTAKDEDILMSKSLIQKGVVLDVFMKNLLVDQSINLDKILIGDKNALLFAARMLLIGNENDVNITCPKCAESAKITIDISEFETREIDILPSQTGTFKFELPSTKSVIEFKLFMQSDENELEEMRKQMRKHLKSADDGALTSMYKKMIISINDEKNPVIIGKLIDGMNSKDSRAFRQYLTKVTPDIDSSFQYECPSCGYSERMTMPITAQFFWPDTN